MTTSTDRDPLLSDPTSRPCRTRDILDANEAAARCFRRHLLEGSASEPRTYLVDRGFEPLLGDTPWTVGYAAPGGTSLRDELTLLGFAEEVLLAAGLTSVGSRGEPIDRFRNRLTFGVRDARGDLVGFTARSGPGAPTTAPKYLTTPRTAVFHRGAILFGLGEQATHLRSGAMPVLVDGPLNAIAVALTNVGNATRLAPLGLCGAAALTRGQIDELARLTSTGVIVCLPRDGAGPAAAERVYAALRDEFATLQVTAIPDGCDPAEDLRRCGAAGLRLHLASLTPLADRIVDDRLRAWRTDDGRAEAQADGLRDLARAVAGMTPRDITRESARLTGLMTLGHDTIAHAFGGGTRLPTGAGPRQP